MKKSLLLLLLTGILFTTKAQKIVIAESEEKIEDMKRKGLYTVLELDEDVVKSSWVKKMKEFGSMKTKSGVFIVEQGSIPSISSTLVKLISTVKTTNKGTRIWYAIDLGDAYVSSEGDKTKYKEAEKLLHDVSINLYIEDINQQIKEAEKVLSTSVKDQEKMILKGEGIKNSIFKNRQEKIKLQQRILETDSLYTQLRSDSIQNNLNQKAATETVDKMKKAVDAVKSKITKLE